MTGRGALILSAASSPLTTDWPGSEFGQGLLENLIGFAPNLLGFVVALVLLLIYLFRRAWSRAQALKKIRTAQAEHPSLIVVLVLAPSGFGLALNPSQRKDRDAFHTGLVEGLTEGMLGFAPHARMQAFRYPASSRWPVRREAREIGVKRLRGLQKLAVRTGADLVVASDRRSAARASAVILPRSGEGWFPAGLTLSEAPEKAEAYLAQAIAFHAAGLAAPGAPPFKTWKSADRDRLMEQLAPLILNPPTDKPGNWQAMIAAFDACGDAALQRDFMGKPAKGALVAVRRTAFENAPDGIAKARAALALAAAAVEWDHQEAREALALAAAEAETAPRAAWLATYITKVAQNLDTLPGLLDDLRQGSGGFYRAAEAYIIAIWTTRISGEERELLAAKGLAACRSALESQEIDREELPLIWAVLHSAFYSLQCEDAVQLDAGDREATRLHQLDRLQELARAISSAKFLHDPEQAPKVVEQLLRVETNNLFYISFRQTSMLQYVFLKQRMDLLLERVALIPEKREPGLAGLAYGDLGAVRLAMARAETPVRAGWLAEALRHYQKAEGLLGDSSDTAMARIDGSGVRILYLLTRWRQATLANKAERALEAEEGLREVVRTFEEERARSDIPVMWRAVASEKLASAWAGLAEIMGEQGKVAEAADTLDQAAREEMKAAAIYRSLRNTYYAELSTTEAANYNAQAAALRAAESTEFF